MSLSNSLILITITLNLSLLFFPTLRQITVFVTYFWVTKRQFYNESVRVYVRKKKIFEISHPCVSTLEVVFGSNFQEELFSKLREHILKVWAINFFMFSSLWPTNVNYWPKIRKILVFFKLEMSKNQVRV